MAFGLFDPLDLVKLVFPLVAGILLGYLLRNRKSISLGRVSSGFILALIFSLGFSIGSNGELLGSLPRVGFNAVMLSLLAMLFSVVFVKIARKLVRVE